MRKSNKDIDVVPDRRSKRAIPLNVESMLVEGARKSRRSDPDEESEKLKNHDSDVDTIRGDLETPEPVPPRTRRGPGK